MEWQRFKVSNKWLSDSGQELSWKDQRWRVKFKEVWAKGTCAGRAGDRRKPRTFASSVMPVRKPPAQRKQGTKRGQEDCVSEGKLLSFLVHGGCPLGSRMHSHVADFASADRSPGPATAALPSGLCGRAPSRTCGFPQTELIRPLQTALLWLIVFRLVLYYCFLSFFL